MIKRNLKETVRSRLAQIAEPMNNQSQEVTFRDFLSRVNPGYMDVVPNHWLDHELPVTKATFFMSIYLLILCIPGNTSQILVMIAYIR